jgi:hypothetical protein
MAIEKVINITVNNKGSDKAIAQTEKLNSKLKELNKNTAEVTKGMKESANSVLDNGGAMGLLNDATGGLAMSVKDAVEATALFSKESVIATNAQKVYTFVVGGTTGALKALRIALAATGLGAIVLVIGLLIEKMNDATEATEAQASAQEALNKVLDETNRIYKESITSLQNSTKEKVLRAKIAGKSEAELMQIEKKAEAERYQNYINERNRLNNELKDKNLSVENFKKIQAQLSANQKEYFDSLDSQRISDLEKELSTIEARRQANKERLEKEREDQRKEREEKFKAEMEYQKSLAEGLNEFQIAINEAEFRQKEIEIENQQKQADEIVRIAEERYNEEQELAKKALLFQEITEQSKVDLVNNTFSLLSGIAKKGSAFAKAVAIADVVRGQVSSISKTISSTVAANAKAAELSPATFGQPFVAVNTLNAGLGIASSVAGAIKAIKDINSESKSASGGSVTATGGGSAPAPSFNIVEGTGSNQIAQTLGRQAQPIKAYVTSSEVTTSQALDRNIVEGASL